MNESERTALAALNLNWAPTLDDVWRPPPFHVDGLHESTVQAVMDGLGDARRSQGMSPIGLAVLGSRGTGKTHLLGSVRERVQEAGGYFFLVTLLDASAFWRSVALAIQDGFARQLPGRRDTQLSVLLRRLASHVSAPSAVEQSIVGDASVTRPTLDAFVDLLRKKERQVGLECQDTARALVLRASDDHAAQDVGYNFLLSNDEEEPGERAKWGMRRGKRSAQEVVRDMSRLMALTGPTVIAVDQIDLALYQSRAASELKGEGAAGWQQVLLLEQIAGGLMSLREMTRRTLTIVTCLIEVWDMIQGEATDTVQDRFRRMHPLGNIPSPKVAHEIVARRFAVKYSDVGFRPPYPTWPIKPEAFEQATYFTPRNLLVTVDRHIRGCLQMGRVQELSHLVDGVVNPSDDETKPVRPLPPTRTTRLDDRFEELRRRADPTPALDKDTEDSVVPELLAAGLKAWIAEQGEHGRAFTQDPLPGPKPSLHARLRQSLDENSEDETHWAFRAVVSRHAIAALNRIRNAATAAGLAEGIAKRRLFLLRTDEWSPGARTKEVVAAFEAAGGQRLAFPHSDIKTLIALRDLQNEEDGDELNTWFLERKPTQEISFLQEALADVRDTAQPGPEPVRVEPTGRVTSSAVSIPVGTAMATGAQIHVDLEVLRKHTAIFAGSGSGKTVLIRRLVEECALKGVSAIVLDPNNDLARLGDPWPTAPSQWGNGDDAKAAEYLTNTEVVVWTPRREGGRPLSFQPLPDFSGVVDDADEFAVGVDAAVAALAPRAKVDANTNKALLGQAVLRQALTYYAKKRRSNLREFIRLLTALPNGVSALDNAEKIAWDMAQTLTAAMELDPMFGGDSAPVDPGLLLTPSAGKRARVSVISLVGLASDEHRQSFVNQLQLALFAWIKRNPASDRPLGALFVMDEAQTFAPSGALTPCTQSTLALASQARKYGLGLVFATQAPKGLHNRIPGNAATQFFGLLNHPTQISAARELARYKGSDIPDVGRLGAGQFYTTVEGSAFEKVQAPLCLTYHPKSPLTTEEVIDRAKR